MEEGQSACEMTASYLSRQVGIADLDYRAVAGEAVQEVTSALRVEPRSFLLCDGLHQQVGHTSLYKSHRTHLEQLAAHGGRQPLSGDSQKRRAGSNEHGLHGGYKGLRV